MVSTCAPHEGAKAFKCCWLGDTGLLCTLGFTKQSKRELCVWTAAELSEDAKPLVRHPIDNASGVLLPFYDPDSGIVRAHAAVCRPPLSHSHRQRVPLHAAVCGWQRRWVHQVRSNGVCVCFVRPLPVHVVHVA